MPREMASREFHLPSSHQLPVVYAEQQYAALFGSYKKPSYPCMTSKQHDETVLEKSWNMNPMLLSARISQVRNRSHCPFCSKGTRISQFSLIRSARIELTERSIAIQRSRRPASIIDEHSMPENLLVESKLSKNSILCSQQAVQFPKQLQQYIMCLIKHINKLTGCMQAAHV